MVVYGHRAAAPTYLTLALTDRTTVTTLLMGDVVVCYCRDAGAAVPQMTAHVLHWLKQALASRAQFTRPVVPQEAADWRDASYSEDEDTDMPTPTPGQQGLQRLFAMAGTAGLPLESGFRVVLALLADEMARLFLQQAGLTLEELYEELDAGLLSGMTSYVWSVLSGTP